MSDAFDLLTTYVHLETVSATPVPVGPDFWEKIGERKDLHSGRLATLFRMSKDWDHWEVHPAGDELVVLLSGAVELVLDEGPEKTVALSRRGAAIVPRGVWHWARVLEPSEMLFLTPGEGTRTRPA